MEQSKIQKTKEVMSEGGQALYNDLCSRLIRRILEFNPDEHDIELNLCGIIAKVNLLTAETKRLKSELDEANHSWEIEAKASNKMAKEVDSLTAENKKLREENKEFIRKIEAL